MYALYQRRLFTREIAERLRNGRGSVVLVSAPVAAGSWSLGPRLAVECAERVRDARILEIDGTDTTGSSYGDDHSISDALLVSGVTQIFEHLRFEPSLDALRDELRLQRDAVDSATSLSGRAVAAARFCATAAAAGPLVLVVVGVSQVDERTLAEMRRMASYVSGFPLALLIMLPPGTAAGATVPPLYTSSISRLGLEDTRDLIRTETRGYVEPVVASWLARAFGGRIADIAVAASSLSAGALAGRELLPYDLPFSADTQRMVSDKLSQLKPQEAEALIASQLQLVQDDVVVERVVGCRPVRVVENLSPSPEVFAHPAPRAVTRLAVLAHGDSPRDLALRLAEATAQGSRERAWYQLLAGEATSADVATLVEAARHELSRGSLDLTWRILSELEPRDLEEGHRIQVTFLTAVLALHLGCALSASTRFLQLIESQSLKPADELLAITGFISVRDGEDINAHSDRRIAARLRALAGKAPLETARCFLYMAAQEILVGETNSPLAHLDAAEELLAGVDAAQDTEPVKIVLRELRRRLDGASEGAARVNDFLLGVPPDMGRLDLLDWGELVIRAYLTVTNGGQQSSAVAESFLSRLSDVSPYLEAQAVALRAVLDERRGWTAQMRERLESEQAQVPVRSALAGRGSVLAAQAALLFGDTVAFSRWYNAMTIDAAGGWTAPQQLWASILEASSRLVSGDSTLASLVLGPAVSAPVPRKYLDAVWSSVVDMLIIAPEMLDRVPGLRSWVQVGLDESTAEHRDDRVLGLDDRILEVLLADDIEATGLISRLVLDAVVSGAAIWQIRANMACAARLFMSPTLSMAGLGIGEDAVSSSQVLRARAHELAVTNEMAYWITAIDLLRKDTGAMVESDPVGPVEAPQLTEMELQVARLAAQGWRNKDIAGELYMAVRTVELRLTGVYRALNISSRKDLAPRLIECGLLEK
ncbi:ATP-dependent transcriptional regulator [Actinomyces bovis]|uniref:ATP-dependent transcriptional regulator n=1 Tax=Actinomyces bovis TaxID=1658 RepID=A0ABY1VNU9_9ACTO|nr:helix-turn-helix transcriptional regulator [Actinomyces bovis]SPT53127.1 ATP-dependent transcriptional regulator [Actinomyces bovis]VEG52275.1 ATP-dependent transcriptional regulator [Actinomyces israelii]